LILETEPQNRVRVDIDGRAWKEYLAGAGSGS
jgi:hypothetical protein